MCPVVGRYGSLASRSSRRRPAAPSRKPNGYRRTVDLLVGQLAAVPQGMGIRRTIP